MHTLSAELGTLDGPPRYPALLSRILARSTLESGSTHTRDLLLRLVVAQLLLDTRVSIRFVALGRETFVGEDGARNRSRSVGALSSERVGDLSPVSGWHLSQRQIREQAHLSASLASSYSACFAAARSCFDDLTRS